MDADTAMRGTGVGPGLTALCPSSDADFLPGLTAEDEASCFVVLFRRGFNVEDASDPSESSVSLSPLMLLELRITKEDGTLVPNDKKTTVDSLGLKDGSTIQVKDLGMLSTSCPSSFMHTS